MATLAWERRDADKETRHWAVLLDGKQIALSDHPGEFERGFQAGAAVLRQDLLAALGEPLPVKELALFGKGKLEGELSWRRGWNAKRESMLNAINRLLPEEG